jgi:argininosuccinate lyase
MEWINTKESGPEQRIYRLFMKANLQNEKGALKTISKLVGDFTVSLDYDRRLYKEDIDGSIAHVKMLAAQGIIPSDDCDLIVNALIEIEQEIEIGEFPWDRTLEDIHMNIESRLHEKIGAIAGKLHTARSRNDQVCLDMRMYVKKATRHTLALLADLQEQVLILAESNSEIIIPGYTHLQKAQPVLFAHHLLSYFEMFTRDFERFQAVYKSSDVMPLGSGALAGVTYDIDRSFVARELGFSELSKNSMDAVSDRDFLLDYLNAASICVMHISRFSEEVILWTSQEFGWLILSPDYTTGSSMMPQKRNPDFAEISRGKTGRIYGNLLSLLTVLKGLPLTYNRDLQEDKEGFFDTYDSLSSILVVFKGMLEGATINQLATTNSSSTGLLLATDIADYLVGKGIPFREAYNIVDKISDYCLLENKSIENLTIEEFGKFSDLFEPDVKEVTLESSIDARDVYGGTARSRVALALKDAKSQLKGQING